MTAGRNPQQGPLVITPADHWRMLQEGRRMTALIDGIEDRPLGRDIEQDVANLEYRAHRNGRSA